MNILPPDTEAPIVTISGEATVSGEYGMNYIDAGASWTDNVDGSGDISIIAFDGSGNLVGPTFM